MKRLKDECGQTLVVFALFMGLVATGFLAFAVDAGMLFHQKTTAQAAADAVAVAVAEEVALGDASNKQSVANAVAKLNGFDTTLATNPATVTLQTPSSGNFSGTAYVQATVSKPIHTYFLGVFNSKYSEVTIAAQSIGGGANTSPTCVCLEGTSGTDLAMSNGSSISAPACGVVDNSTSSAAATLIPFAVNTHVSAKRSSRNTDSEPLETRGARITLQSFEDRSRLDAEARS